MYHIFLFYRTFLVGMHRLNKVNKYAEEYNLAAQVENQIMRPYRELNSMHVVRRLQQLTYHERMLLATLDLRILSKNNVPNTCHIQ